eukprot:10005990-Alexandrium_andersonii.AAC.1
MKQAASIARALTTSAEPAGPKTPQDEIVPAAVSPASTALAAQPEVPAEEPAKAVEARDKFLVVSSNAM